MTDFKDHFSGHAAAYRLARPGYPGSLFHALAERCSSHDLVWDVGCGNGQASVALAEYFGSVCASDPSRTQIEQAVPHARVRYVVAPAERIDLDDACADLVTVAQALHWFDLDAFHAEATRVLRPGGLMAQWGYAECSVSTDVDRLYQHLYESVLGPYWPEERVHIEQGYADLPFPFAAVPMPDLSMQERWNLRQYLSYLNSWSALQRYQARHAINPLQEMHSAFTRAWGDPETVRAVTWRFFMRVGRILP